MQQLAKHYISRILQIYADQLRAQQPNLSDKRIQVCSARNVSAAVRDD